MRRLAPISCWEVHPLSVSWSERRYENFNRPIRVPSHFFAALLFAFNVAPAQSFPICHFELAEAVASKGFVVASIPRLGITEGTRLPFDTLGSAEYQRDLQFVLSELSSDDFIDSSRVNFITWSFEGVPALEVAQRLEATQLFLSFDSSLGYNYVRQLIRDTTTFFSSTERFPLIHFTGVELNFGKDLQLLEDRSTGSDIEISKSVDIPHGAFTALASLTIPILVGREPDDRYL